MSKKKEEPATITMTEEQLERIIRQAVRGAMHDLKKEEDLPGNEVDELQSAPATFTLICLFSNLFLALILCIAILFVFVCGRLLFQSGFNFVIFMFGIAFVVIGILALVSIREVNKTKKIEVINTIFNATVGMSSLIVAIVGAYFAYKSTK